MGNEHQHLVSAVPGFTTQKISEISISCSNHNLGIVPVQKYFKVALEWKPVCSLFINWYCRHMTHTCMHKPVRRDSLPLNSHPRVVTPCLLGSGNGAQRSVPAASTGDKVERGTKCSRAPALSPCHGAAGRGEAPAGEVQAEFVLPVLHFLLPCCWEWECFIPERFRSIEQ